MRTGLRAILGIFALMATAVLAAPSTAVAAPQTGAGENPLEYLTYEKTITAYREAGTNAAAGPAAISCTLAATFPLLVQPGQTFGPYNPFYMGVGGIARITCTAPVTQLSLVAIVNWDGVPLTGPPVQTPGSVVYAYAMDVCSSGDWSTGGSGVVSWPPGYGPPSPLEGMLPPIYIQPIDCV